MTGNQTCLKRRAVAPVDAGSVRVQCPLVVEGGRVQRDGVALVDHLIQASIHRRWHIVHDDHPVCTYFGFPVIDTYLDRVVPFIGIDIGEIKRTAVGAVAIIAFACCPVSCRHPSQSLGLPPTLLDHSKCQ